MGALHDGHLALMRESMQNNDFTIVSIFVNPKQFNKQEDFDNYPNTLKTDLQKLQEIGVSSVDARTPIQKRSMKLVTTSGFERCPYGKES